MDTTKRIRKEFEKLDTKVEGFPLSVEKTLPMHPNFKLFWAAFPQIHPYFEDVPKVKKKASAE